MDPNTIAAIVAQVLAAQAQAPVVAQAASPFAVLTSAKAKAERDLPASVAGAMDAAPDGQRQEIGRLAAAYFREAGFACDATTRTLAGPDGPRDTGHGFVTRRDAGVACPTSGCEGKIL